MKIWMTLLFAVTAAAQPQFAPVKATPFGSEPVKLSVDDPSIDATKIKPYRAKWKETFVTPANQVMVIGTWTDEVQRANVDGRSVIKRTITVDRPQRNIHAFTMLVVDGRTFAPLVTEESEVGKPADLHLEFRGTHVTGKRHEESIDAHVPVKAFDTLAGMTDLFPATLALRAGYAARFPNFSTSVGDSADPAAVTWITLQVKRQDTIALPDGRKLKAWLVDSDTPLGFYKVWIADEPPYIVRTIWMGPGGGRSTFDLISAG